MVLESSLVNIALGDILKVVATIVVWFMIVRAMIVVVLENTNVLFVMDRVRPRLRTTKIDA